MCVFMVSEQFIIRGQEVALKSRCGVQVCHLHSCHTDVHFAAFTRLQFAELGLVEFRTGRGIVPRTEQNTSSDLRPTRGIVFYESASSGLVNREPGSGQVDG